MPITLGPDHTYYAVKRILILGMSHLEALSAAVTDAEGDTFEIVNLNRAPDLIDPKTGTLSMTGRVWQQPDVVCLSIEGNLHNVFSLRENPAPFRLGDATGGAIPADAPDRHFIPRDMMTALFRQRLKRVLWQERVIHTHFKADDSKPVRFIHICPPPPGRTLSPRSETGSATAEDRSQTVDRYAASFGAGFTSMPAPLRLALYRVQRDICDRLAAELGATVLAPPEAALSPDGLLDATFRQDDPTHGNAAYGRLVLDQIRAAVGLPIIGPTNTPTKTLTGERA